MTPELAVVMTANRRRPYLEEAVQSLLQQTLPRGRFEVVIVSGYRDLDLARVVEEKLGRWIMCEGSVGRALAVGVGATQGDFIAFLDDDDTFAPEKLQEVLNAFIRDDELGYFHNAFTRVDEKTRVLRLQGPRPRAPLTFGPRDLARRYAEVLRVDGAHNLSAIAVRRSVLRKQMTELGDIGGATDRFMFYAAVASGLGFRIDPRLLTYYRVHVDSAVHTIDRVGSVYDHYDRVHRSMNIVRSILSEGGMSPDFALELSVDLIRWYAITRAKSGDLSPKDFARSLMLAASTRDAEGAVWPLLALTPGLSEEMVINLVSKVREGSRRL